MKTIAVYGSTGSIGCNSLKVIDVNPNKFKVVALIAGSNYQLLAQQINKYKPQYAVIYQEKYKAQLQELINVDCKIYAGKAAINEISQIYSDIKLCAIMGMSGINTVINAVQSCKIAAIANKEPIITFGEQVIKLANQHNCKIIPVDSEHNSVYQTLQARGKEGLEKVTLTASGGGFWQMPIEKMHDITPQQAVKHPNWSMGAKISVDSASLINKLIELIEAAILFDLPAEKLDAIIHPTSIVHSIIDYNDGMSISAIYKADMRVPISYAMGADSGVKSFDLRGNSLEFHQIDEVKYPIIRFMHHILSNKTSMRVVFNAVNEELVSLFLQNKIKFTDIYRYIERTIEKHNSFDVFDIKQLLEVDISARKSIKELIIG